MVGAQDQISYRAPSENSGHARLIRYDCGIAGSVNMGLLSTYISTCRLPTPHSQNHSITNYTASERFEGRLEFKTSEAETKMKLLAIVLIVGFLATAESAPAPRFTFYRLLNACIYTA